jgi:phage-related protein
LSYQEVDVVVEVLGKRFSLQDITLDVIPPELFQWEIGGLLDPIGQLINWLWSSIQQLLSIVRTALEGALWTVRDYLYSAFQNVASGITSVISGISSTLSFVYSYIQQLPATLSSLFGPITSAITGIGSSITGFGSFLSNIWQSLQGLGSSILGGITSTFSNIQGWLTTAIGAVSTGISSFASTFTSYITQIATKIGDIGTAISGVVTSIVSSVQSGLTSLGTGISTAFAGITTYLSSVGQVLASSFAGITTYLSTFGKNIFDAVLGLKDWLLDGFKTVAVSLTQLWDGIKTWVIELPKWFGDTWTQITSGLATFGQTLTGFWQNVQAFFTNAYNSLGQGVREVMITLGGFVNPLVQIGTLFNQFVSGVIGFIKDPWTTLGKVLTDALKAVGIDLTPLAKAIESLRVGFTTFLKDPWTALGKVLTDAFKTLGIDLTAITKGFPDFAQNAIKFFGELPTLMKGVWTWLTVDLRKWLTEDVPKWFEGVGKGAEEWLKGLNVEWLNKVFESVVNFIKDPMKSIGDAFKGIIEWGQNTLFPAIQSGIKGVVDVLTNIGKNIWDGILSFFQTGFEWMATGVKGLLSFFTPKSPSILDDIAKFFADLLGTIFFKPFAAIPTLVFQRTKAGDLPKETPMESTVAYMGGLMLQAVSFPYLLSAVMRTAGDSFKVAGELGIPKATFKIDIKPGLLLKHLAKVIWKLPDVFLGSLGYGFGIWMTQPLLRVINSFKRNEMPIEMPNLQEIREITNRASTLDVFEEVQGTVAQFMAYYGYSDWSVSWNLGFYSDLGQLVSVDPFTTVKDRFANDIQIPLALRHRLPSGSEFATMMVRDLFLTFEDFTEAMTVEGYGPDVSKLYYLMHYKYPSMDALWKFIARVSGGFGWAEGDFEKPAGLGFDGATPKALSAQYAADPIKGLVNLSKYLLPYAKWHDFAPFAWQHNFTSDRLIMVDLMARLPDRIEGRWMYKWSIIDDVGLQKLVVAEGFHPNVIENVAIAEAMNALTEERSAARTGILNTYEAGFYSLAQVNSKLQQITTVSILGKERTIKLLDGERKLEVIRSNYDRAKAVLSGLWRSITTAFSANLYPAEQVMTIVTEMTTSLKTVLGLDLTVDQAFLNVWLETYHVRWKQQTIQRIRSLMRVFIYRASQLAEAGEDVADLIDRFAATALLTPTEAEIMKTLALAFVRASQKSSRLTLIKQSVSSRLKRGVINTEQAITELVSAGMTEEQAKAWLEANARFRTVSTDKLVSMAEYIPIDTELLKEKMDSEGVPLDEQPLYLAYRVASEIAEEMGRLATEYVEDCVAGSITDDQFKEKLDNLATLDGTVQTELGMEWIVLSPTERKFLITLAKMRKMRRVTPETGVKGLSSSTLIAMMEQVPISIEMLRTKLLNEGIPTEEVNPRIAYGVASQFGEEIGRLANEYIENYVEGTMDLPTFKTSLDNLATLNGTVQQSLGVPWIVLSPEERTVLVNLGMVRRQRKEAPATKRKVLSTEKLVTMMEQVPVDTSKLLEKMTLEGIPADEQKLMVPYSVGKEIASEMGRIVTELLTDHANGVISIADFNKGLDDLATLGGAVPQALGVDWIVLSPIERALLTNLAKLRRMRVLAKQAGAK